MQALWNATDSLHPNRCNKIKFYSPVHFFVHCVIFAGCQADFYQVFFPHPFGIRREHSKFDRMLWFWTFFIRVANLIKKKIIIILTLTHTQRFPEKQLKWTRTRQNQTIVSTFFCYLYALWMRCENSELVWLEGWWARMQINLSSKQWQSEATILESYDLEKGHTFRQWKKPS